MNRPTEKNRISIFIDGFNVYHSLKTRILEKYKWLNYRSLCEKFLTHRDVIENIYYFTALVPWDTGKVLRHQKYIKALETVSVVPVFGKFKRKNRFCRRCLQDYDTFEEKQTDVNIAIKLFQEFLSDRCDTALILTGDTDLVPAIKAVKETFPKKRVGVIFPINARGRELKQVAHFSHKIKEPHLRNSQFDPIVKLQNGRTAQRPNHWT